jgi:hypothetical protein
MSGPPQSGPHTSEADRQQQHHPNITDWIIAGATVGMLVATGVSVVIANKQWKSIDDQTIAMQGQLAEMKSGSEDTKILAKAATEQVSQLKAGVDETHKLAVATQESLALARSSPLLA